MLCFDDMKQEVQFKGFDWLQGEIQRQYESLSPHLKRVAEYLLADPGRFALQTITQAAGESGVQPSTLVRFAKLFGYRGFSDMQQAFRAHLTEVADSFRYQVKEQRARLAKADGSDLNVMLDALANASITAINRLRYELDPRELRRAVQMLDQARSIHVIGPRHAWPVATCLSLGLVKLGCQCHLPDSGPEMLPYQLASLTKDDLLVAISLVDFPDAILESVTAAHQRQVPVLAISTSPTSALARNSSLNLVVRDPEVHRFEPLAPHIVLVQTLVITLALTRDSRGDSEAASGA